MAGLNGQQVNRSIALKEAGDFLVAAPGLGLRGRTAVKLAKQLIAERVVPERSVRRRTSQVQIAFDFYLKALIQREPDISFFFTNHVASSMHRYWPALFPDDYTDLVFDQPWIKTWSDEIPFVMQEAEEQISSLIQYVEGNPDNLLVIATSMGQAAVEGRERVDRTVILSNLARLMSGLDIAPDEWEKRPAMVPQVNIAISESKKSQFLQNIGDLFINGKSIDVLNLGSNVLRMEFCLVNQRIESVDYKGKSVAPAKFGISCIEMMDAAGANAYHIPQGMLMVYDPKSPEASFGDIRKISTREVAPSIPVSYTHLTLPTIYSV